VKLIKLLLINKSLVLCGRRVRRRFLYLILALILIIFLAVNWDKLRPATFVTSVYWQMVFR
jgi:hypothetical protein